MPEKMNPNPIETVKGTPGSAEPAADEKKAADNQAAEAREHGGKDLAGRKPGEADAPEIPKSAKPNFE